MRTFVPEENLPTIGDALRKFMDRLPPRKEEVEVGLMRAVGKVASRPVKSPIDNPPFARSLVDGFALMSSSTPGKLRIVGKISIGEWKDLVVGEGEAVEVDTGSLLPQGADSVVKVEHVTREEDRIVVNRVVRFGSNVAWPGSDVPKGTELLSQGQVISPEDVGALASVGISKVRVYAKPKVYVIATGDELVEPGSELPPGKIYESNIQFLRTRLEEQGYEVVGAELLPDEKDKIEETLLEATNKADVIITTGGTSAGEKDYVHQVLREKGELIIHGVNFKPGKPTILAVLNGKPVFGLSGNVVATVMIFDSIVMSYLKAMDGTSEAMRTPTRGKIQATTILPLVADRHRTTSLPVYVLKRGDDFYVIPIPFESYMIGTFSLSDGYVTLPPNTKVKEGERVEVTIKALDRRQVIIGEDDARWRDVPGRKILLGTVPACQALKYGVGDVLLVSTLLCDNVEGEDVERWILVNGKGPKIGYEEWVGLSSLVRNPSVRLKSPSTASIFVGRAEVVAPEGFIHGRRLTKERLKLVIRDEKMKFLKGIFSEGQT